MDQADRQELTDGDAEEGMMKWDGRPYDMVDWEHEASLPYWRQIWRAKWNLLPRGPTWLPEIIRMTWYLTVINIVLGIHGGIDGDVGGPFFYSRTCCCGASGTSLELPPHFDIWYPRTCNHYTMCKGGFNVTFVKACDVPWLNPEQPAWSHSPYCQNWDYVRDFTQRLGAGRRMSLTMTSLFCMPIGAGISDKTGRKPMYFFSFMLGVKSLLFNLISSTEWSIRTDPNGIILYISGFLSGMGSGAGPIGMAMMVDLIPGDMREQGFPIMSLFGVPGQIVVFAIGYMLLHKHLSHYTIFWEWSLGTDFICMLFVLFLMPETMPDSLRRPLDWWDFFPGTYYFYALRIIFNYPLLTGICPCIMLWSFSGNGMGSVAGNQLWMGPLSFRQEESLIPGLVGMICGIPANILGAIVIPRVGVWPAIFFGSFVGLALGLGSNIWPIFWMNYYHCWTGTRCGNGDWGTELFIAKWGGTMIGTVLGTFLGAISGPAGTAMISMQVKQTEQASIQAAFNLIGSLSGMYAPLYFTNHFFDTDATSWRVIRFAFVGYSMQLLASCLYVVAWAMDRWIRRKNRTRVVLPKETPLDLERRDYAADYRREKLLRLGQTQGMSKVQGRGGDHQNVSHTRRAKDGTYIENYKDAKNDQELQPLIGSE